MNARQQLTFGPLFSRTFTPQKRIAGVSPLQLMIEAATSDECIAVDLYCKGSPRENCGLEDIVIDPDATYPFDFQFLPFFGAQTEVGMFPPFESFLVGMYSHFSVGRPISTVLTELRDHVGTSDGGRAEFHALVPALSQRGYIVSSVHSYGRRVFVRLSWVPPQDRQATDVPMSVVCAHIQFRPTPNGRIENGKWRCPNETLVGSLLYEEFCDVAPSAAADAFTEAGKLELLRGFEWTPLARMTAKQARTARIEFVRAHPELAHDRKLLAKEMMKAGLYSENSTLWNVAKMLESVVKEASG